MPIAERADLGNISPEESDCPVTPHSRSVPSGTTCTAELWSLRNARRGVTGEQSLSILTEVRPASAGQRRSIPADSRRSGAQDARGIYFAASVSFVAIRTVQTRTAW